MRLTATADLLSIATFIPRQCVCLKTCLVKLKRASLTDKKLGNNLLHKSINRRLRKLGLKMSLYAGQVKKENLIKNVAPKFQIVLNFYWNFDFKNPF